MEQSLIFAIKKLGICTTNTMHLILQINITRARILKRKIYTYNPLRKANELHKKGKVHLGEIYKTDKTIQKPLELEK